jgi:site-specific recombinase XerD
MLFNWLVTGQVVPNNLAAAVRGPKHVLRPASTPALEADAWRNLLKSIPTTTLRDLRDRALIATLTCSFARITAALKMKVDDLRPRGDGWSVRLREKGGKHHTMPCHHALAELCMPTSTRPTSPEIGKVLSENPMTQPDAWRMIRRRAAASGIAEAIGCHTFRATGITAYLATAALSSKRRK